MKNEPASIASQSHNGRKFSKAIVMGASIAGLWTARALADHFEEVLVLERDQLPEGPDYLPVRRRFVSFTPCYSLACNRCRHGSQGWIKN